MILEIWSGSGQWQVSPIRIENSATSIIEFSENLEKDKTMMIPFYNPWAFGRIDER